MTPRFKVCTSCLQKKPLRAFYKLQNGGLGRHAKCKPCYSDYYKHPDRRKLRPAVQRKYAYGAIGLTLEAYQQMLALQKQRCALCFGPFTKRGAARPVVDHDHKTGRIRGVIHNVCNLGIGLFYDNPDKLKAAAAYLRRNRSARSGAVRAWTKRRHLRSRGTL